MILIDEQVLQHSHDLKTYIKGKISNNHGRISFAEYMQHVLYAPRLGYYNAGTHKFGKEGDFITAPEMGSLFARTIAIQIVEILQTLHNPYIFEIGAGSGRLACDLLSALDAKNCLPEKYLILEISPDLRFRQQELVMQQCPQYMHLVHWLDTLPQEPISGVIIANEVIDAMPVTKFLYADNTLQEYFVTCTDNEFSYVLQSPSPELQAAFINAKIKDYIIQPYSSEINPWLQPWLSSISNCLHTGAILLCDYGFNRVQYYHPQRNQGTLICHHKHKTITNPFLNIGLQDITAHVDFTHVAEVASVNNLHIAGYTNLACFLINCGIHNLLTDPNIYEAQELNVLTSYAEMGELFKVMLLSKMQQEDFIGFSNFDKTFTL